MPLPAADASAAAPWWQAPAVLAAALTFIGGMTALAINLTQAWQDRKREVFAAGYATVASYWEFPYVVRRRRHDQPEAERVRISEELRKVQERITHHEAWTRTESKVVGHAYARLAATTRRVIGPQIASAWTLPPVTDDASMNIGDVTWDGLCNARDDYLAAVADQLSLLPAPLRRAWRRYRMT